MNKPCNVSKINKLRKSGTCSQRWKFNLYRVGMLTGTALILSANSVLAQWKWNLGFAPEYFYWQENDGGAKLLDESGLRYGLDLSGKQIQIESWLWAADFKIYYGSVDYNGQTMGGTPLKKHHRLYRRLWRNAIWVSLEPGPASTGGTHGRLWF